MKNEIFLGEKKEKRIFSSLLISGILFSLLNLFIILKTSTPEFIFMGIFIFIVSVLILFMIFSSGFHPFNFLWSNERFLFRKETILGFLLGWNISVVFILIYYFVVIV